MYDEFGRKVDEMHVVLHEHNNSQLLTNCSKMLSEARTKTDNECTCTQFNQ